jgi:hypothetical protein
MTEDIRAIAARLRTEAVTRRHLDLPIMSVRPSDMLRLLDVVEDMLRLQDAVEAVPTPRRTRRAPPPTPPAPTPAEPPAPTPPVEG